MAFCSNSFIYSIVIITIFCASCRGDDLATIVRGADAANNEFPSVVSIRRFNSHICGGTFVTKCDVLTAAHCIRRRNFESMTVAAGSSDQASFRYFYKIRNVTIHPDYKGISNYHLHDIAVIKLEQCIVEDTTQQIAGLYGTPLGDGVCGTVVGWGRLHSTADITAQILQRINTWTISNAECLQTFQPTIVRPLKVCTINSPGAGFCGGDSGGPLFVNGYIAGIVSLTSGCAAGKPDIYTRVYDYIPWLLSIY